MRVAIANADWDAGVVRRQPPYISRSGPRPRRPTRAPKSGYFNHLARLRRRSAHSAAAPPPRRSYLLPLPQPSNPFRPSRRPTTTLPNPPTVVSVFSYYTRIQHFFSQKTKKISAISWTKFFEKFFGSLFTSSIQRPLASF